jgi:hypothetical protein
MPRKTSTPSTTRAIVQPAVRKPRVVRKRTVAEDAVARAAADTSESAKLDREDIAGRAYELFLAEGGGHGRDVEHWLQAERELRQRLLTSAA